MLQLGMKFAAMLGLQRFDLIQRGGNRRPIRIFYPNVQLDKRLFDLRLWHFGNY